jgi:hypothetical protein
VRLLGAADRVKADRAKVISNAADDYAPNARPIKRQWVNLAQCRGLTATVESGNE